jgi:hypothetical protein
MLAKVLAVADDVRMLEWGVRRYLVSRQLERIGDTPSTSASRWPFWSPDNSASSPTLRIRRLNIRRWGISELWPKQTSPSHARWPSWRQDWRTEPCPTRGHAGPGRRLLEPERRPLDHDDPHRPDTAGLLPAEGRAKNASLAPDAQRRPGNTPVRTALSPRYLIRPPWPGAATRDENRAARPSSALLGAAEPVATRAIFVSG